MNRTAFLPVLFLIGACGSVGDRGSAASRHAPPAAEFFVATQDSTFWIRAGADAPAVRVRGAPLVLATFGGRWYEIFLADDDRSFPRALLVGQQLYRRDLLDGDSAVVYTDSVIPRMARAYARAHPGERPLAPDEDGDADPPTQAVADVEILGLHGPYLSYAIHRDITLPGRDQLHETRRGVVDLRTGRAGTLATLAADTTARRALHEAFAAFAALVDSARQFAASRQLTESEARASAWLVGQHLDTTSFSLTATDGDIAAEFVLPERNSDGASTAVVLDPVTLGRPAWWAPIRDRYAIAGASGDVDEWKHARGSSYQLRARYAANGESARFSIVRGATEWPAAIVAPPIVAVYWLDRPSLDSTTRGALARAFNEASQYDETTRTVRRPLPTVPRIGPRVRLASLRYRTSPRSPRRPITRRPT